MKKRIVYTVLIYAIMPYLNAQINLGGIPYSARKGINLNSMTSYQLPAIDKNALLSEDVAEDKQKIPPRFGKKMAVNLNIYKDGIWHELSNGDRLWVFRIKAKESISLNFVFDKFYLHEGSLLYIYRPDKKQILGAYSSLNNKGDNINPKPFGTSFLYGDEAIIELYQPRLNKEKDILSILSIVHGYRLIKVPKELQNNYQLKNFGDAGSCQINVNCPEGNNWQDEKTGVAMYIVDGDRWCSGCLLNNKQNDGKLYFLTANHCLSFNGDNTALNLINAWVFLWGYESPNCANPSNEPALTSTTGGAVLKSRRNDPDFALVELSESPYNLNPPYLAFFNGWSRNTSHPSGGVGIHHPRGDIKKISEYIQSPTINHDCPTNQNPFGLTQTGSWSVLFKHQSNHISATENGSSGSPLFNANHKVIGQLETGFNPDNCRGGQLCANPEKDISVYGRFDIAWNGSSSSERLKDWLDPNNKDDPEHNGGYSNYCSSSLTVSIPQVSNRVYEVGQTLTAISSIEPNVNVTMQAGQEVIMQNGFHAKYSSDFTAKIGGCTPRVILKMVRTNESFNSNINPLLPNISIYPNPSIEFTTIKLDNISEGSLEILVRDIQGKILAKLNQIIEVKGSYQTKIDISDYPNGVYLVSVNMKGYQESIKLKVEK